MKKSRLGEGDRKENVKNEGRDGTREKEKEIDYMRNKDNMNWGITMSEGYKEDD